MGIISSINNLITAAQVVTGAAVVVKVVSVFIAGQSEGKSIKEIIDKCKRVVTAGIIIICITVVTSVISGYYGGNVSQGGGGSHTSAGGYEHGGGGGGRGPSVLPGSHAGIEGFLNPQ